MDSNIGQGLSAVQQKSMPLKSLEKSSAPSTLGWLIHSKNGLGSEPDGGGKGGSSFGLLLRIGKGRAGKNMTRDF